MYSGDEKYSRLPVYSKDTDHIVGIVNLKDVCFAGLIRKGSLGYVIFSDRHILPTSLKRQVTC